MQKTKEQIVEEAVSKFRENAAESAGNYDSMMEPENQPGNTRIDRVESMCYNLQRKADEILRNMATELMSNNVEQAIINKKKPN